VSPGIDQTRGPQQTKVLGDGRTAHPKISRDLADRSLPAAQETQDFTSRWIGYRAEYSVAPFAACHSVSRFPFYSNHLVTIMVTDGLPIVKLYRWRRDSLVRSLNSG
jgi:hypothetical protein